MSAYDRWFTGWAVPPHIPRHHSIAQDEAYEFSARERQRRDALDEKLRFLHEQREKLAAKTPAVTSDAERR
jgi:hypothetical protein